MTLRVANKDEDLIVKADHSYEISIRCNETKQTFWVRASAPATSATNDAPAFKAMMRAKFETVLEKVSR